MWIPAPVYEALPPIYGVAGTVAIGYSLNGINVMSGLQLIAAGLTVWWQRRESQKYVDSR